MPDAELMRRALARAREGVAAGQSPFGALIARGDRWGNAVCGVRDSRSPPSGTADQDSASAH